MEARHTNLEAEVLELRRVVEELKGRLDGSTGTEHSGNRAPTPTLPRKRGREKVQLARKRGREKVPPARSRRDLLKIAGAAAVGAAGAGALGAVPAAAATGDPLILGHNIDASNSNVAENPTEISYDGPAGNKAIFLATDTFSGPAIAAFPSAVAGWGNTRAGVYGYSTSGYGVVAYSASGYSLHISPTFTPTAGTLGDVTMGVAGLPLVCVVGGNPATFAALQPGRLGIGLHTAVSTQQYTLTGSDGATWVDMDSTKLLLSITPHYDAIALVYVNADLWTTIAGVNQDIGVFVSGGAFPSATGQPEAWKESGGFAGTFSPNAAFLHAAIGGFVHDTTYTVKVQWKTNKSTGGSIVAGAGPIGSKFSPTRLSVQLVPA